MNPVQYTFCPVCGAYLPMSLPPVGDDKIDTFDAHMRREHPDWVWTGRRYAPAARGHTKNEVFYQ